MSLPKTSTSGVTIPRSLSKESTSLRNLKVGYKFNEISSTLASQNQSKSFLKSKMLLKTPTEATLHKRTISDSSSKFLTDNNFLAYSAALCQKLRQKLSKTKNPEDKINMLLYFMENLGKAHDSFSEFLTVIGETVKEYQKYIKNLDSTRVENNETNLDIKNSVFSKELCRKIHYKSGKSVKISGETSILKEKAIEPVKIPIHKRKKSSMVMSLPTECDEPNNSLQKSGKKLQKPSNIPAIRLSDISTKAYQEEFMEKFDEFSDSWKAEILKLNNYTS